MSGWRRLRLVGCNGVDTAFLTFDEAIKLIDVILKFPELVLRCMTRGYNLHQRFQVVVGCGSGG